MNCDRLLMRPHNWSSRRAAFSLIEMAVAVSILSVILALSATTIISLFRLERRFAADVSQLLQTDRLAAQWRLDVHRATAADMNAACELRLPTGETVHYAYESPAVTRELRQGGEFKHRDAYVVGKHAKVTFSSAPETEQRLLVLRIAPSEDVPPTRVPTVRLLRIEAAMNLHGQPTRSEVRP